MTTGHGYVSISVGWLEESLGIQPILSLVYLQIQVANLFRIPNPNDDDTICFVVDFFKKDI